MAILSPSPLTSPSSFDVTIVLFQCRCLLLSTPLSYSKTASSHLMRNLPRFCRPLPSHPQIWRLPSLLADLKSMMISEGIDLSKTVNLLSTPSY
ncbi:hypothetical protein U1Q18_046155 [Sarracenia purpurea var. burkii]